jgi:TM2 domain-containing membrane protein YozV
MDCVNHTGVTATAFCQSCGTALCAGCVRNAAGGQVLCEPCWTAWHTFQQPFTAPSGGPHPSAAAILGLIPGVGAMYNGQFFKGFVHVAIFVVLISITDHYPIFGIFIAAWILYQSFEAFHTAKAIRDGQPLPDPLGLNEVGNWLNLGGRPRGPGQAGTGQTGAWQPGPPNPGSYAPGTYPQGSYSAGPYAAGQATQGSPDPGTAGWQPPYTGQQTEYQQVPYAQPAGTYADPAIPPAPPVPPLYWKRKEPIGAIVLIGLGVLFLLGQLDWFSTRVFEYIWPLGLIALGAWMIVRRLGDSKGGSK